MSTNVPSNTGLSNQVVREPLRPMEPGWLESENESQARRKLASDRCRLMESALRAVGFSQGTQPWALAVFIAKISDGWEPLVRDLDELANDRDFPTTSKVKANRIRMLKRDLKEVAKYGLLQFEFMDANRRRRTRPSKRAKICTSPQRLNEIIAGAEIRTFTGHSPDNEPDNEPDKYADNAADNEPDICKTIAGHLQDHSLLYSHSHNSLIPSPPMGLTGATAAKVKTHLSKADWEDVGRELRQCGKVDRWKSAIREAIEQGLTPEEFREAVYVLKHTADLNGGALFDWIRSGAWPLNSVRSAEAIREQRRTAAEIVRQSVRDDAASRSPIPADWIIQSVCYRRLIDRKLDDQASEDERAAHERHKQRMIQEACP